MPLFTRFLSYEFAHAELDRKPDRHRPEDRAAPPLHEDRKAEPDLQWRHEQQVAAYAFLFPVM